MVAGLGVGDGDASTSSSAHLTLKSFRPGSIVSLTDGATATVLVIPSVKYAVGSENEYVSRPSESIPSGSDRATRRWPSYQAPVYRPRL
jgi:hypothetical protein